MSLWNHCFYLSQKTLKKDKNQNDLYPPFMCGRKNGEIEDKVPRNLFSRMELIFETSTNRVSSLDLFDSIALHINTYFHHLMSQSFSICNWNFLILNTKWLMDIFFKQNNKK